MYRFFIFLRKTIIFLCSLLLLQNLYSEENYSINPDLQDNFVIISALHSYDLNPHTASYSAEAQILTGLYEGLFSYDPITLDPLYALVKSYRVSRDKKRWTFILRDDAKFSDGSQITAKDVVYSWLSLIQNPDASYSSFLDIIHGAKAFRLGEGPAENVAIMPVDDYTLSVHLISPASHFPKLLCMPAFSVVKNAENVFSGPFVISERTNDTIILKKNSNYYDAEHVNLKQITLKFSNDELENTYNYNIGTVDWLCSTFNNEKLLSKDSLQLYAEFATQYYFFKIRKESICSNLTLRQALLEATPWETLRENVYVPASTLVYPLNGYPLVQGYIYTDKNEAKLLVSQAKKELQLQEQSELKIKFAIPDTEYMIKKAEILKEAWNEIGVTLEISTIPDYEYLSSISKCDADLFTYTWIGDFADPLAFLELFRGNSTMNVSNWKNSEYDSLLDKAALSTDEEHNKLLSSAEQILLDDAILLPVQHPVSVNIINLNAVGGWAANAFDIHPLKYLFKKETKDMIPNIVMLK